MQGLKFGSRSPNHSACSNSVVWTIIFLFDLIMSPSTTFQLCRDKSSWVEPVLSKDKYVLLKDTAQ